MAMLTVLKPPITIHLDNGITVKLTATDRDTILLEAEQGYVMALPHEPHYIELQFAPDEETTQ